MNKKFLSTTLFLIILLSGLTFNIRTVNSPVEVKSTPIFGFDLIKPPLTVTAYDYETPLVTTNIGLFLYYQHTDWTLVDTIAGWQSYTNYGDYIDGVIRVYMNGNETNFEGEWEFDFAFIDVQARVRTDGYILTWLNRTDISLNHLIHWGMKFFFGTSGSGVNKVEYNTGDTPDRDYLANATCLYRAMERIFNAAGEYANKPTPNGVYYYDFENIDATRFVYFGKGIESEDAIETGDTYYTVPSAVSVIDFAYIQELSGSGDNAGSKYYLDDVLIVSRGTGAGGVSRLYGWNINAAYLTLDVQHKITVWADGSIPSDRKAYMLITMMIWTH